MKGRRKEDRKVGRQNRRSGKEKKVVKKKVVKKDDNEGRRCGRIVYAKGSREIQGETRRIRASDVPVDTSAPLRRRARKLLRSLTSCSSFAWSIITCMVRVSVVERVSIRGSVRVRLSVKVRVRCREVVVC
jgi:hypothetical protein